MNQQSNSEDQPPVIENRHAPRRTGWWYSDVWQPRTLEDAIEQMSDMREDWAEMGCRLGFDSYTDVEVMLGRADELSIAAAGPAYTPQQMAASFRAGQSTERMQGGEVQGDALDVEWLKERISSIHSTVSLGHQTGPHAYAGEDFGRYLAEAAGDCREIVRALDALAARQPGAQERVAYWLAVDKDGVVEFGMSADDANAGQASRQEVNDFINGPLHEGGVPHRLVGVYTAPPAQGIDLGQQRPLIARSLAEWNEDDGNVMWWAWCGRDWAGEPAWCGTPNDSDWPGYHTHWTQHPTKPVLIGQRDAAPGVDRG